MSNSSDHQNPKEGFKSKRGRPKRTPEEKKRLREERKAERKRKRRNYRVYKRDIKRQYRKIQLRQLRTYAFFILKLAVLSLFLALIGVGVFAYSKYGHIIHESYASAKEHIENLDMAVFTDREPTVIYDKDGNVLRELAVHDFEYVKIDDIQNNIKLATIAIEDERYLEHDGVDFRALSRAFYYLVKNSGEITQGGSTITQQLVKTVLLTHDQTYSRKLTEVFISFELEKRLTKKQILEYYLNNIYFGNGAYGIESASNYYFSKPSSELTLSEATLLMAIPNNPSLYDPFKRMENTQKRQSRILQKMYEQNFITHEEFTQASLQNIEFNVAERPYEPETYLVSYAISDATKKLMKTEGFEFKYHFESDEQRAEYNAIYSEAFTKHNQAIRTGGYHIYTSLDQNMQNTAQDILNKQMSYATAKNSETGLYKRQSASVIIDNETGHVKAIVGGRTQSDVANTYNRAFLAHRQPGSTMKPIAVYTQMFERNSTRNTVVVDEPQKNGPRNVTGSYVGATTIEDAVIKSINTIPFREIQKIGVQTSLDYLRNMQFTKIVDSDDNPTVAIGGITYGATPLEMAGAYMTLARNGEFVEPTAILKIDRTSNGKTIYEWKPEPKQVYDAGASYMMTEVLEETAKNGYANGNTKIEGYATATKTGTTNDIKDTWIAGYSPYYTMAVWVGEDTPRKMAGRSSYDDPLIIWRKTMVEIHKGLPKKPQFDKPVDALKEVWINPRNGRLSETAKSGWSHAEVPKSRWDKQVEADRKAEEERQRKLEEERKLKEEKERKKKEEQARKEAERKKAENELNKYLKSRGTTLSDEQAKRKNVMNQISALKGYHIHSESDYGEADSRLADVQKQVNKIIHIDYKEEMQNLLNEQTTRLDEEKTKVERDKVLQKYQSEQAKNRRKADEIRKQEMERLDKETAIKVQEEKERLEREKAEQDRLDKEFEEKQKEEENNPNPETPIDLPSTDNIEETEE